jgi:hypothetical protein
MRCDLWPTLAVLGKLLVAACVLPPLVSCAKKTPVPQSAAVPAGAAAPGSAAASQANKVGDSAVAGQVRAHRPDLIAGLDQVGLKAVMKEVASSMGQECDSCHDISDFSAQTVNKKIAGYMYGHFSLAMEWKDGSAVTCASCHRGDAKFLGDRKDKKRIGDYMQAQFVERLRLKGGGEVSCETCHGPSGDKPFLPRS